MKKQSACSDLHEYMRKDDNLFDDLRMMWDWNDEEFRTVVALAARCLEELESEDMIPRFVASFFGSWLQTLKGTMRNPLFLKHNQAGRSEQDTKAYFDRRIEIIYKLVSWMSNGKRLHPPEHFILPEWSPPAHVDDP